jgi:hypothetical protein
VLTLSDGSFVVGSQRGDLFRFGADYKLRNHVTLGSFGITALGTDPEADCGPRRRRPRCACRCLRRGSFLGCCAQALGGSVFDFEKVRRRAVDRQARAAWSAWRRTAHGGIDSTETHGPNWKPSRSAAPTRAWGWR